MRVVIDTNVLLSALLGSRTRPLLLALLTQRLTLITSDALAAELMKVLSRPTWRSLLGTADCRNLLRITQEAGIRVTPSERVTICRDATDNAFLEAALAGHANYLITGDADLLTLGSFHGTRILRPRDFLRLLSTS